ncbi:MAG: BlaI/MecI/CopY family transcriptional regulator [Bacteroidia bacterium]|nr:BlaI/MecI/CopY family transcriptional regulator [Bacteroidia bacterium]
MIPQPTNGELKILRILWKQGPSTVREINEVLNLEREVGYTTTLKLMQIMHDKGQLSRTKSGKTHIYTALLTEQDTQKQLVDKLKDSLFQGSALKLVMQALGDKSTSADELKQIRDYLDELSDESKND